MSIIKRKEAQEYDPIPKGVYFAVVEKIQEKKSEKHPEWTPQVMFTFKLIQKPFKNRKAWGYAPSILREGQKLDRWITSLLGQPIPEGQEFDILSLIGKQTKVSVFTPKDTTYPKVDDVFPLTEADTPVLEAINAGSTSKSTVEPAQPKPAQSAPAPQASTPAPAPAPAPEKPQSQQQPAPRRIRTVPF